MPGAKKYATEYRVARSKAEGYRRMIRGSLSV